MTISDEGTGAFFTSLADDCCYSFSGATPPWYDYENKRLPGSTGNAGWPCAGVVPALAPRQGRYRLYVPDSSHKGQLCVNSMKFFKADGTQILTPSANCFSDGGPPCASASMDQGDTYSA